MKNKNLLSRDLQDILRRNGLQAEVVIGTGGKAVLNIVGDRGYAQSPPRSYELTPQQLDLLVNARQQGTGARVKKAYNMLNSIIARDFIPPQSYTVAFNTGINRSGTRNSFNPVNMGWNGVAEHVGRSPYSSIRRMDHRVDGSLRPGETGSMRELPGGLYVPTAGYVWKGNIQQQQTQEQQLQSKVEITNIAPNPAPRPQDGNATLLKDHVTTGPNDNYAMLEPILSSHGIVIKEGKDPDGNAEKQLVIMAKNAKVNITYHLTDEEYRKLTADKWLSSKDNGLQARLDIINSKASLDFQQPITTEMLNSSNYVDLDYKEGRREVNEARYIAYEQRQQAIEAEKQQVQMLTAQANNIRSAIADDPNAIDGRDVTSILKGQAFFNEGAKGRQLVVGEIRVDKADTGFTMTADINGTRKDITISEKEYNRFLDYDDAHRLKMFADKFDVAIHEGQDNSWQIVRGPRGLDFEQNYRIADTLGASVNANILQSLGKGFYAEQKGGREKAVTDIWAFDLHDKSIPQEARQQMAKELGIDLEKDKKAFFIVANIDGNDVIHRMSEKQYNKYMAADDNGRLKIADKLFNEFKIKREPGHRGNTAKNVLGILGGLAGAAVAGLTIKHAIDHPYGHRGHPGPPHGPGRAQVHWPGVPVIHPHPPGSSYHHHGPAGPGNEPPQPLAAAQRAIERFEQISEEVALTAETVANTLHK